MEFKKFSPEDVSAHNTDGDIYIAIHSHVYDVSKFASQHPYTTNSGERSGGSEIFFDVAGKDATEAFEDIGHSDEARAMLPEFTVGELE
ncbi:cytochrome-b5 reductase, partial [Geosmithia morbida]